MLSHEYAMPELDIVESLRNHARDRDIDAWMNCEDAADEIEKLREECARFRAALNAISCQDADYKDVGVVWCASRARAALGEKE